MVLQMNAINGGEKKIVCNVVIYIYIGTLYIYTYIYLFTYNQQHKKVYIKKNGWFVQCTVTHTTNIHVNKHQQLQPNNNNNINDPAFNI